MVEQVYTLSELCDKATNALGEGQFNEAIKLYLHCQKAAPDNVTVNYNLGVALFQMGQWPAAQAALARALAIKPDMADAKVTLGMIYLSIGKWAEGWALMEQRFLSSHLANQKIMTIRKKLPIREATRADFAGKSLAGRRLLLIGEQGFGDMFMVLRFAKALADKGLAIDLLNVRGALTPLLEASDLPLRLAKVGDQINADYHCGVMSLPYLTGLADKPDDLPPPFALSPPPALRDQWQARRRAHKAAGKKWIGLVGSGRTGAYLVKARSLGLKQLAETLVPFSDDYHFISLQRDLTTDDATWLSQNNQIENWGAAQDNFADSAAQMQALDGMITIDTAAAHLAGSLGVKGLLLLRSPAEFRWLQQGAACPWYPSLTALRQPKIDDWQGLLAQLPTALTQIFNP